MSWGFTLLDERFLCSVYWLPWHRSHLFKESSLWLNTLIFWSFWSPSKRLFQNTLSFLPTAQWLIVVSFWNLNRLGFQNNQGWFLFYLTILPSICLFYHKKQETRQHVDNLFNFIFKFVVMRLLSTQLQDAIHWSFLTLYRMILFLVVSNNVFPISREPSRQCLSCPHFYQ